MLRFAYIAGFAINNGVFASKACKECACRIVAVKKSVGAVPRNMLVFHELSGGSTAMAVASKRSASRATRSESVPQHWHFSNKSSNFIFEVLVILNRKSAGILSQ
jgi:hypothetical protein